MRKVAIETHLSLLAKEKVVYKRVGKFMDSDLRNGNPEFEQSYASSSTFYGLHG